MTQKKEINEAINDTKDLAALINKSAMQKEVVALVTNSYMSGLGTGIEIGQRNLTSIR